MMTAGHSSRHLLKNSQQLINKPHVKGKTKKGASPGAPFYLYLQCFLSDEFVDRLVELLYGIEVIVLDCIDDAGRHVFLEDHAAH